MNGQIRRGWDSGSFIVPSVLFRLSLETRTLRWTMVKPGCLDPEISPCAPSRRCWPGTSAAALFTVFRIVESLGCMEANAQYSVFIPCSHSSSVAVQPIVEVAVAPYRSKSWSVLSHVGMCFNGDERTYRDYQVRESGYSCPGLEARIAANEARCNIAQGKNATTNS